MDLAATFRYIFRLYRVSGVATQAPWAEENLCEPVQFRLTLLYSLEMAYFT